MEAVVGLIMMTCIATGAVLPLLERYEDHMNKLTFAKVYERMKAHAYFSSVLNEKRVILDSQISILQVVSGNPYYPYMDKSNTFSVN